MADRLIQSFAEYDRDSFTDYLSILAREIEDALLQCGSTPEKDYTYRDIFTWAIQALPAEAPRKEKA